jgi:PAS domain-containing protein
MGENSKWVTGALLLGMLIGIVACLWRLTAGPSTPNEALLLSLVLTIFSMVGSWIASRHYAEVSFNRNLRLFALKAAEKVTNLSDELNRLSAFLQEELKSTEYESPAESLLAKNVRIEGAIHVINTLKSVNDRSLSDWQGVIGEEISAQREMEDEREESLRELLDRLESLSAHGPEEALRTEVESIRTDLRFLAAQITGVPVSARRLKGKIDVQKRCPQCAQPVQYRQRVTLGGINALDCTHCGSKLYSKVVDGGFELKVRVPISEEIMCPSCAKVNKVTIDPVPGAIQDVNCHSCNASIRVIRAPRQLRLKLRAKSQGTSAEPVSLSEELLARVRDLMGQQPWPSGRSRAVALEMGVHHGIVQAAIQELVRRGVFRLQVDGTLYVPEKAAPAGAERSG